MEIQYRDTLPNDVRSAFDKAIEALPQDHLRPTKLSGAAMAERPWRGRRSKKLDSPTHIIRIRHFKIPSLTPAIDPMAVTAAEQIRKRSRKDNEMETSRPQPKKRKVSKEDESQLELQEQPTQESAKSRRILDTFLTSLRDLAKYWTYAKGLLQVLEQRVSKLKSQRNDAESARSQYAEPPGQHDNQSFYPQPNSPTEVSSPEQSSEGPSERNGGEGQISPNSGGLADLGLNAHTAAADFDTSMVFQGAAQDPLLDDLFLLDASAFDFHFYENIS
ncbi:uncharacterized protein FMAN_14120 [Fusarium mangiferae]|uniref:Uncharacterized protein n=1 Tax=Fusarium mangiferae TaxID=192010 RepID=A0A1L7UDX5_FUSMA|nr:uncharacterized protein FMAN_14120 [Fusarium mangiferae]CVL08890.1 uncharacterized protein FMAN_14120 [Fusarium mangiferae]